MARAREGRGVALCVVDEETRRREVCVESRASRSLRDRAAPPARRQRGGARETEPSRSEMRSSAERIVRSVVCVVFFVCVQRGPRGMHDSMTKNAAVVLA